jgi:hypothetical protein
MSNHLSQNHFAQCLAGRFTRAELKHITDCAECNAELERFGNTMALFRNAIRERIENRSVSEPGPARFSVPTTTRLPMWRWALVAAGAVVLIVAPFVTMKKERQEVIKASSETNADALMNAVNLHLSRTVPAPMERMISLIPNDDSTTESGGVQ